MSFALTSQLQGFVVTRVEPFESVLADKLISLIWACFGILEESQVQPTVWLDLLSSSLTITLIDEKSSLTEAQSSPGKFSFTKVDFFFDQPKCTATANYFSFI